MEKEIDAIFDEVINDIKKDLTNHTPPKVGFDPKKKTISVQYDFGSGLIKKVKLIANRETWLKIYEDGDFDHDVSFDDIEPYLSRPAKNQKIALKNYAQQEPELFSSDVLTCVESAVLFQRIVRIDNPR